VRRRRVSRGAAVQPEAEGGTRWREGQPATWRQQVIKVAVRLSSSARRVVIGEQRVALLEQFQRLMQRLLVALAALPPRL